MKKQSSSTGGAGGSKPRRSAKKSSNRKTKDPFAAPPHPLGYTFLEERPRLRATQFGSILPSVVAKYGMGRRLSVERFHVAWRESLAAVLGNDPQFDDFGDFGEDTPGRLEMFLAHTRPASFRGGVLRVEVDSNLLANELHFQIPELMRELHVRLPNENLERLTFVVR